MPVGQGRLEDLQLAVHFDAQCLERAPGGMEAPARRGRNGLGHDPGQLRGGGEGSSGHDGGRDAAAVPLVGVTAEDRGQRALFGVIDDVGCGYIAGGIHPHVERAVEAVAEAPFGPVELGGTDSEVEQAGGDPRLPDLVQHITERVEPAMPQGDPVAEAGEALRGGSQRVGVAVQADQAQMGSVLQESFGMAAPSDGAVDHDAGGRLGQYLHNLPAHDRQVEGARAASGTGGHVGRPVICSSPTDGARRDFSPDRANGKRAEYGSSICQSGNCT